MNLADEWDAINATSRAAPNPAWPAVNAQTKAAMPQWDAERARVQANEAPINPQGDLNPVRGIPAKGIVASPLADEWDSIKPAPQKVASPSAPSQQGAFYGSPPQPREAAQGAGTAIPEFVANRVTSLGANIIGGLKGLATAATSGGSIADRMQAGANEVRSEVAKRTYEPAQGSPASGMLEAYSSPWNPLTWLSMGAKKAGEAAQDYLGASPAVATGIETGIMAAPLALGLRGKAPAAEPMPARISALNTPQAISEMQPLPSVFKPRIVGPMATAEPLVPLSEVGKQKAAPIAETPAPVPARPLTAAEQSGNADVLRRVGFTEARESAIKGDANAAKGDFDQTKLTQEKAGIAAKAQFDMERKTLESHADSIIQKTGGTRGLGEDELHVRGNTIVQPFDAIRTALDEATSALYKQKDIESKGLPTVSLDRFKKMLETNSTFAGKAENQALRRGVRSYLKEQSIMNADGSLNPVTAQAAEGVRQYINSQWSPATSGLARIVKNNIDKDVLETAGTNLYQQARALHELKKATVDNPTGISKLMDYDPRTPANRAVSIEKIPDYVTRMPLDQFKHVVKVLKDAPPEIQPQAQAALAEIKAQFANKVAQSGSKYKDGWNYTGVSEELKARSGKMREVFTPEELAAFLDLDRAGHILKVDRSYAGAGPQAAGLIRRGMMHSLAPVGAATGGAIGGLAGPVGSAVGAAAGARMGSGAAQAMGEAAALKAWQKRIVRLK